jgi:flagellar motility protein MotE (MotC chaperone)
LTFDLRQAAKTLGIHQQSWNMAVAKRDPPVEGSESSHSSFYSHTVAEEIVEEESEEDEDEKKDPNVIDIATGRPFRKKEDEKAARVEPAIQEIDKEVESLKKQLADAREIIQTHEQVLSVLSNMDPDETVSSIGQVIQLGRKKKGWGRRKKNARKKDELVAPVPPL